MILHLWKHLEKINLSKEDIVIGLNVYVIPLGKNGIVKTLPNSSLDVEVEIGNLKTNINISQLVKISKPEIKEKLVSSKKPTNNFKSKTISQEINVIGLTIDEALPIVDKYLDDAYLAHLSPVRIVHGKGTGALRAGVHNYLKRVKYVKSYRLGAFGEGDAGVTIVEFK